MPELQILPRSAAASFFPGGMAQPMRVVIENVQPEIDAGRFPVKREIGDEVVVTADIHADGHDVLAAVLRYRFGSESAWRELRMAEEPNDVWRGQFRVDRSGSYEYMLEAWVDAFATWRKGLSKKVEAGQDIANDLDEGARLIRAAAERASPEDSAELHKLAAGIQSREDIRSRESLALGSAVQQLMTRYDDRPNVVAFGRILRLTVDPVDARFSAWYELFPRSTGQDPLRSATLRQAETRLSDIAAMGFSVVYLPPVHPIGKSHRKGPNNSLRVRPQDPGSPWAIGSEDGGHKAIDPALGHLNDFDYFVAGARKAGLSVALDLAFQCSPDHPYVRDHPEWFHHRADGSIKQAENPPKVYEDIVPFDFECADWPALWQELKSIVLFWMGHGIRHFRVDNPHTKPYRFWEWLIREVKEKHPETLFLAEAFTRPKPMAYLAKCGFTQSYTYFTWRNTKTELTAYLLELTRAPLQDVLRPNFFVNTPDILPEFLQQGGPPAFLIRLFLAATLSASYGIYGPAFELGEAGALPGTEEYQDSEKYQIRVWDMAAAEPLRRWIARINRIRQENPALHANEGLRFYPVTNESLLCYAKTTSDFANVLLIVVTLDPHHSQDGWVSVTPSELGLQNGRTFQVHDLLSGARYTWRDAPNYVRLDPAICPAHVFEVRPS